MLSYLKGQKKLDALPDILRNSASSLNKELVKTKKTFAEMLPDKELKKYMLDNLKTYMRKSFAVFTNPEYNPKKEVLDNAVSGLTKTL